MKIRKKILSVFLSFLLATGAVSALPQETLGTVTSVSAETLVTEDGFNYQELEDGTVQITDYTGYAQDLVVPGTINGKTVSTVKSYAFYYDSSIKSITFSEGITTINSGAIYNCRNLASLSFPSTVTSIGEPLIYGSHKLSTITVASGNKNYISKNNILYSKDKTVLYLAPAELTSFTVPSTVKRIAPYAFYMNSLKSVKFNEGLEAIDSNAFFSCSELTSITFPSTLVTLGYNAFASCSELTTVKLNAGLKKIDDYCFRQDQKIKSIVLPEGLETVGDGAFLDCLNVESVTVPASVKSIGNEAFGYYYTSLGYQTTTGLIPDFYIRCYYDSKAMYYAVYADIPYELIDAEKLTERLHDLEAGNEVSFSRLSSDLVRISADNGAYYLNVSGFDDKLVCQSFTDGRITTVHDFIDDLDSIDIIGEYKADLGLSSDLDIKKYSPSMFNYYVQGNKLYLGYSYYLTYTLDGNYNYCDAYAIIVYDMASDRVLKAAYLSQSGEKCSISALGADQSGRLYIAKSKNVTETVTDSETGETSEESVKKYYIDMYNSSMRLVASTEALSQVYYFGDFDKDSGVFSMCVYYNWRYWGYDHAMHAIALGKAGKTSIEVSKYLVGTIGQTWYSTIDRAIRHVGKYLCTDTPLSVSNNLFNPYSSGMSVYDVAGFYNSEENNYKFTLERKYYASPGSNYILHDGSRFARVSDVPGGDGSHIIAVEGDTKIGEYDPEKGSEGEIGSITVDHPVYELLSDSNHLYIIMRDYDDSSKFHLKILKWSVTTKLTMSRSKLSMKVGNRKLLKAVSNGTMSQKIEWSSSDPTVASVSSEGAVTAMKAGKAVITAKTAGGLKAACTVTVTDSALADIEGGTMKAKAGQKSTNKDGNSYIAYYSLPVKSYINQNSDGTITRAEYIAGKIYIGNYSADGKTLESSQTIAAELPIFGGLFFGKTYNFIVFGQQNLKQSDSVEVVRVVKYSKAWEKLGSASIKGVNTYIPFDAGSLRMDETGGRLYIHTCHEMYDDGDGYHHQANMTFVVKESNMKVEHQQYEVYNYTTGYVSHSFNQFVKVDGDRVYRLDQGDANPRGLFLNYFIADSDPTKIAGKTIFRFGDSEYSYNYTNANVGGFEVMNHNAVAAISSLDQDLVSSGYANQYNIYLVIQDKDFKNDSKVVNITNYAENSNITVGTPQLVKINQEIMLLMWQEKSNGSTSTKFVTVNEDGILTSDIVSLNAAISDCQPVYGSDKLVHWYVTDNSLPTFYSVNPFYLSNFGKTLLGDVNGDGSVNVKDLTTLQRYINGWDVTIIPKNSDLNGDGKYNVKDLTALQKLINSRVI